MEPQPNLSLEVFRITHKKWSTKLEASGYAARWNSSGVFMIYSAENRSLACLENLVHRRGIGLDEMFCVMTIKIPKSIKIDELTVEDLPENWDALDEEAHLICRNIGDVWIKKQSACVMYVPSAIIDGERNLIINPMHKDFEKILIKKIEPFTFNKRLI